MKKRNIALVLAAVLIAATLAGCGKGKSSRDYDLDAVAQNISSAGIFTDILSSVDSTMAQKLYGYDSADVVSCSVMCSTGATAEEIALFKCADKAAAARVLAKAQARVAAQKSTYSSYAPNEVPKLDGAVLRQDGVYVFCVVSTDADKANEIINS